MGLPSDYKLQTPEKKQFDPLPEDTYQAAIRKIELLKDQPVYQKPNEFEDQLEFEFEVIEEGQYKGRKLWQKVRPVMTAGWSGGQPSWLYKLFCAVNNIKLNDEEAKATDANSINGMLGKQVRLIVKQKPDSKGNVWNRITDMLPVKAQIATDNTLPMDTPPDDVPPPMPSEDSDINVEDIPF